MNVTISFYLLFYVKITIITKKKTKCALSTQNTRDTQSDVRKSEIYLRKQFPKIPTFAGCPSANSMIKISQSEKCLHFLNHCFYYHHTFTCKYFVLLKMNRYRMETFFGLTSVLYLLKLSVGKGLMNDHLCNSSSGHNYTCTHMAKPSFLLFNPDLKHLQ